MGLYTHRQTIIGPIYGQIVYDCCLTNAFKFQLEQNLKIFLVKMKRATGKEIAEHVLDLQR